MGAGNLRYECGIQLRTAVRATFLMSLSPRSMSLSRRSSTILGSLPTIAFALLIAASTCSITGPSESDSISAVTGTKTVEDSP